MCEFILYALVHAYPRKSVSYLCGLRLGAEGLLIPQVSRMPIIYEVNIFITNRFVPIPEVLPSERLLVEQLGVSGFYHVIARCVIRFTGMFRSGTTDALSPMPLCRKERKARLWLLPCHYKPSIACAMHML